MHTPETKKFEHLEQEAFDNIINIHGERGKRIVGYLNTAHQLLEIREGLISMNFNLPKLPETNAYCIREALTEPLEGARNIDQLLDHTSRVVDVKNEYLSDLKLPKGQRRVDFTRVSKAIDGLRIAEEEINSTNKLRVAKLLNQMELQPNDSAKVIQGYVDLIKQVQKAVHERTSGKEIEAMWGKCLNLHKEIYYS